MKRFTEHIKESFNEVKPGNQLLKTGVTNHYTPIQNILTNINNLFCLTLGIVASVGEDGVSIKLSSSQFTSEQKTNELLWRSLYNDVFTYGTSSLQGYISSQGLPKVTMINLGGYFVVYFSPDDMPAIANGCNDGCCCKCDCAIGKTPLEICYRFIINQYRWFYVFDIYAVVNFINSNSVFSIVNVSKLCSNNVVFVYFFAF